MTWSPCVRAFIAMIAASCSRVLMLNGKHIQPNGERFSNPRRWRRRAFRWTMSDAQHISGMSQRWPALGAMVDSAPDDARAEYEILSVEYGAMRERIGVLVQQMDALTAWVESIDSWIMDGFLPDLASGISGSDDSAADDLLAALRTQAADILGRQC